MTGNACLESLDILTLSERSISFDCWFDKFGTLLSITEGFVVGWFIPEVSAFLS
jgi:hypothetical protein